MEQLERKPAPCDIPGIANGVLKHYTTTWALRLLVVKLSLCRTRPRIAHRQEWETHWSCRGGCLCSGFGDVVSSQMWPLEPTTESVQGGMPSGSDGSGTCVSASPLEAVQWLTPTCVLPGHHSLVSVSRRPFYSSTV